MNIEDSKEYVLDVKNTLLSNLVYFAFCGLFVIFLVKAFNFITNLQTEEMKLLGLIVFLFAFIEISAGWSNYNLEYKPRILIKGKIN